MINVMIPAEILTAITLVDLSEPVTITPAAQEAVEARQQIVNPYKMYLL